MAPSAPQALRPRTSIGDFTLMLNVWRSWSLNQQMLRDRMQDVANTMRQTGESLRAAASGQSEAFDRDFADAVVKADPTKYRLVAPSQYRVSD